MKIISLNKQQITNSIILLLGSEKTKVNTVNKVTGVYNFKGITEGTKLRIDRILKILGKEELEYNKRQIKTVKEFYIENNELTEEEKGEIISENYRGDKIELFLNSLDENSDILKQLDDKTLEIENTSIEIQIEPFLLSKIEDLSSNDTINYSFIYDNFTV